jgi:hypothetical protein
MKTLSLILITLTFTFLTSGIDAQTRREVAAEVRLIEQYTNKVDRVVNDPRQRFRIFGDVSSAREDGPSVWKEFKNENEMDAAGTGENLNVQAKVWAVDQKIAGAKLFFTSPSGDWAHFVDYYFRPDGSLAKIRGQLNTFYGNVSVIRSQYYSASGKLLQSSTTYFDLTTHRRKRKPVDFFDQPVPVYPSVDRLPFNNLL